MRDHGGNLDWAMQEFGGLATDWIDLSTGINPEPYPLPSLPSRAWTALPTQSDMARLIEAAKVAFGTKRELLPVAGAQAAIQMMPGLKVPGLARVLGPTYNEHAAAFMSAGWSVETVAEVGNLAGADAAIVVNPNNPDGRVVPTDELSRLAGQVGHLIVDESFADPTPDVSIAAAEIDNLVVLRSFGKFYGLAGLRLGFVIGAPSVIGDLREKSGPWPVSGVAIEIGARALSDKDWQTATIKRLVEDADRLDTLASRAGWSLVGGTTLFRYYETPSAASAQTRFARAHVWSRIFPYSDTRIRLGLPPSTGWPQVQRAFDGLTD